MTCWLMPFNPPNITFSYIVVFEGFFDPYFNSVATSILIALSRSHLTMRPVISATLPNWLSCSCNVVSKHYAPDKNLAIRRMISYHTLLYLSFNCDILLPVCNSSWYVHQQISWQRLSQLMPHLLKGYLACVIDLIGNQPILCQRRI